MSEDGRGRDDLDPRVIEVLDEMWATSYNEINAIDPQTENWKIQTLPLARIKKIMKSEEFIMQELEREKAIQEGNIDDKPQIKFMISAEAPLLMSKACELLIKEISTRAWYHTEDSRRRTLQRQDVHKAVSGSEVFDFLIDIVPRATSSSSRASLPTQLPEIPPIPNMAQIPNLQAPNIGGSLTHQGISDFSSLTDPLQGQFPFFNALSIPGLENSDGSSLQQQLGAGLMTIPGQQVQQQQQLQQQQLQQQQQHILLNQGQPHHSMQQSFPQWNDPPV